MTKSSGSRRPPIHMIDSEADMLSDMALAMVDRSQQVATMLLDEIGRAKLYRRDRIPADVVILGATVDFDDANGATRSVQLVYPKDADIAAGRISILTPVGAGLIGLREGQSILWPDRNGRKRELKITGVKQAPPAP